MTENGFKFEAHSVTTEDGYELTLHRIPPQDVCKQHSTPVLLQHGMDDSSYQWVVNSPDKSIAFMLAKHGYDVWMANTRGNFFSQKHQKWTPDQAQFWDFDYEEMGTKDQPANIDHILNTSHDCFGRKFDKIAAYVGHSQGTTQFFAAGSLMPEYFESKVNLFVALAPVVRFDLSMGKLEKLAAKESKYIERLIKIAHLYNWLPQSKIAHLFNPYFCSSLPKVCTLLSGGVFGITEGVDDKDRWDVLMAHAPAGNGWRSMVHYAQTINAEKFQRYDWGPDKNQEIYGQSSPPEYDLSKFPISLAVASGDIDPGADPLDVAWLLDQEESGLNTEDLLLFDK